MSFLCDKIFQIHFLNIVEIIPFVYHLWSPFHSSEYQSFCLLVHTDPSLFILPLSTAQPSSVSTILLVISMRSLCFDPSWVNSCDCCLLVLCCFHWTYWPPVSSVCSQMAVFPLFIRDNCIPYCIWNILFYVHCTLKLCSFLDYCSQSYNTQGSLEASLVYWW